MTNVYQLLDLVALVSGIYAIYSSVEYLLIRESFGDGGILDWTIVRTSFDDTPVNRVFRAVLGRFSLVLLARGVLGASLILVSLQSGVAKLIVPLLVLTDVCIMFRFPGGLSGASEMSFVVNGSLLIATLFAGNARILHVVLLFVAIQGLLAYAVAGVAKLAGGSWRSGDAVVKIFSTSSWGDDRIFALLRRYPTLKPFGSWTVMTFEILFPLVLFLDPPYLFAPFAVAVGFHLFNAVFMGINGFLFIFPATYPAIFYLNRTIDYSVL